MEKDREYDSTASALEGKRELNADETDRLKRLWKKLVRMFHPDLHEQDPEKRKTYELLTQAINEARDRGDIELLELIAKDPQAFILKQGWASVSLDVERGLKELRSLYEHLQARIPEMIESLDEPAKVARPRRRPQDNEGRKLDAKAGRKVTAWADLSLSIDMLPHRGSATLGSGWAKTPAASRWSLRVSPAGWRT